MLNTAKSPSHQLVLEHVPPASLVPDPCNPRLHKPPQVAAIARSIKTFGFIVPVLVDAGDNIIAGHGRVLAALKLGLVNIPIVRADHMTPQQRQAYSIADNRLCDTSGWNEQLLGEVLRDLSVADLTFELDVIGFSVGEIDMKIEALVEPSAERADVADTLPVLESSAVTQSGDLWLIGSHRLLCGNALEAGNWAHLMDGRKAAMCITDPPYNLKVDGFISGLGKVHHRSFAMASGEMDCDGFATFLADGFRQIGANLVPGALAYVFMDHRHMSEMLAAGESVFSELKTLCAWVKPAGMMGGLYRNQMELVFVWKASRGRNRNNVELGKFGRNRSNVWPYPSIAGFRHSEGIDLLGVHPTCKPVKLVADAILDVTKRGDIVIDPFMGSGTAAIAAERVGRIAYGMEMDPVYTDAILRRYDMLTGVTPMLEATRETFAAVSARRLSLVES